MLGAGIDRNDQIGLAGSAFGTPLVNADSSRLARIFSGALGFPLFTVAHATSIGVRGVHPYVLRAAGIREGAVGGR
jgi:hypothetical protein